MKKLLLLILLILLLPLTAEADPARMHGSWRLVAFKDGAQRTPLPKGMAVVLTFDKKQRTWSADITARDKKQKAEGTWSMERNVLTMEYQGRKTTMIATPSANALSLGLRNRPSRRFVAIRATPP
ncbi:MAG: lipocalin family protein [Deltaproteobacteria bacterium]|jgi:hypothetical protein|nr:lipocalin family protein [Deltaproteobacteria bacterium]MBW2531636.1 lipocalin family protein [Deltaproteobacteria bacterium]